MSKSRRQFLTEASLTILGAAVASRSEVQPIQEPTAGAPPAFGTAPPVGPAVSPATFAESEKLVRVQMSAVERAQAAGNWRSAMAPLYELRTGPRKVELEPTLAPYSLWNPVLPGEKAGPARDQFITSKADPGPLPARDEDIAYAPLTHLASWVQKRRLTSERLTQIYLNRIGQFDPQLRCIITLTDQQALARA